MAKVVQRINRETGEKESFDSLFGRWKKLVREEGTLELLRDRRYFKPKYIERREKSIRAQRRMRKGNK